MSFQGASLWIEIVQADLEAQQSKEVLSRPKFKRAVARVYQTGMLFIERDRALCGAEALRQEKLCIYNGTCTGCQLTNKQVRNSGSP